METSVKVGAVQAEATQCWTEAQFQERILSLTKAAAEKGAGIVVFPEDIDFWLAFVKEEPEVTRLRQRAGQIPVSQMTVPAPPSRWRLAFERATDWLCNHIHLAWLGRFLSETKVDRITARAFSKAAKMYGVVVVGGAYYKRGPGGIMAVCRVYDDDGSDVGGVEKHNLIAAETMIGGIGGALPEPIVTKNYTVGVAICFDLNTPEVCSHLAAGGAQIICVPTSGIRPWPDYPFNPSIDMPQIQRAQENGLAIARAYQCGWLFPGIYFDGHASVVSPDGSVAASATSNRDEQIVLATVPLKIAAPK